MIRIIGRAAGNAFRFAEYNKNPKNVGQYLKMKKGEILTEKLHENKESLEELQGAHRLLYLQYAPAIFFAFPLLYLINDPTDILFYQCTNLVQYYLSGLLCFNSFFTQNNMKKYYYFIFAVGAANCITGPYSLITPVVLGALNFYAPFTDEKYHKFETSDHETKVKAYMKVQGLYYFIAALVLTLKFYYFQQIRQFQQKLNKFQQQNSSYYQSLPASPSGKESL